MAVMIIGVFAGAVTAADEDLAEQYAPILFFEKEETCFPVDISYHIDNSYLYLFTSEGTQLINETPTSQELAQYSTSDSTYFYLDNQRGTIEDEAIIADYQNNLNSLGYTVYAHVESSAGSTVLQYWMFYAFNKGELNVHEGDWEMVQVVLSDGQPTEVMYSQHYQGQKASWSQVERDGDHIQVYVSRGSHANYLRSYSGVIGIASDKVGNTGKVLQPIEYQLEMLTDQEWLDFAGRWGVYDGVENEVRGQVGPFGPKYRANGNMWQNPLIWGNSLSQANDTVFILEWILYNFLLIFIIITVITLLIALLRIYLRYKRYGLGPRIISMFYIDGINIKSIGNIICLLGIILAIFGLVYPWYTMAVDVNVEDMGTTGLVDLIVIDGIQGVKVNLLDQSGSLTQIGAFVLPFSLLIGLGLVFLFLKIIGISHSKTLGKKYIYQGIRLSLVSILIIVAIMSIGYAGYITGVDETTDEITSELLSSLSSQPFGGDRTFPLEIPEVDSGYIHMKWGLDFGGQLLLIAGIIILIAGILMYTANTTFFEPKQYEKAKKKAKTWVPPPVQEAREDTETPEEDTKKTNK
jgi:hypothetical protein